MCCRHRKKLNTASYKIYHGTLTFLGTVLALLSGSPLLLLIVADEFYKCGVTFVCLSLLPLLFANHSGIDQHIQSAATSRYRGLHDDGRQPGVRTLSGSSHQRTTARSCEGLSCQGVCCRLARCLILHGCRLSLRLILRDS